MIRGWLLLLSLTVIVMGGPDRGLCRETSPTRWDFHASSEAQFTEEDACKEAQHRLEEMLVAHLASRTVDSVPERTLRRHLAQLLYLPDAKREESTQTIDKPYGTMYRRSVRLSLSDDSVKRWIRETERAYRSLCRIRAGAALMSIIVWLAAPGVAIKVDRWTRGYRRGPILTSVVAFLVCATTLLWLTLLS